jgi:hypothetical protein
MEVFHFRYEVSEGVERKGQSFSDGRPEELLVYPLEHYCVWCLNHNPMFEVDKLYIALHVQQTPKKNHKNTIYKTTKEKSFKVVKVPVSLNTDI